MEKELKPLIKSFVSVIISVFYCYYVPPRIKCGLARLFSVLPVCALFFLLPLSFSSAHFTFITSTFLTWHANFKLILFAFDKGPLFPIPQKISEFICFTCFPTHPKINPKSHYHFPKWIFFTKIAIFGVVLRVYNYTQYLHPIILLGLYPLHLYLSLEILLTLLRVVLTITLGTALEPFFNEPYLATSLGEFWGRRWNLPASVILRSSVYIPVRQICQRLMNVECAIICGVLASFFVSGLIHELVFFYVTREVPTWEVTWFFILNGVCTVFEGVLKRKGFMRRWTMRPNVSRILTVGFVVLTGAWLFFPQFKRSGVMERFASEFSLLTIYINHELFLFMGVK